MGKRLQRIQDLIGLLNGLYAPALAEEWDNVGLQVGDPSAMIERALVALDPSFEAVAEAHKLGAQALVTHHPLLFRPLKRLSPEDAVGKIIWAAVEMGVAILSVHTNLDSAAEGLNSWLAEDLGLQTCQPLLPAKGDYLKLVVFVPVEHVESVAEALFGGGAGHIGDYDHCSFRTQGFGTFRPGEGAQPFIGQVGQTEMAEEIRLETIVPKARLPRVLERMLKAHPYEEVAYDLLPMANQVPDAGMGRIGHLDAKVTLEEFADKVKLVLNCSHLRLTGQRDHAVHKIAVCSGSGAGLITAAARQGADVLVTGDIKYHDARQAEDLGIALIDAGHFPTERLMVGRLTEILAGATQQRGWDITYQAYTGEGDPFRIH